jgi:transporter family protein
MSFNIFYDTMTSDMNSVWYLWTFVILTIICWGSAPILEKYGLRDIDPFSAVFIRSVAIVLMLIVAFVFSGKVNVLFKTPLKTTLIFTASGFLAGLAGMWTYFKALKVAPSSKVVPLVATYPLITAILSVLILRENVTWGRILGTILIITGVLLVK